MTFPCYLFSSYIQKRQPLFKLSGCLLISSIFKKPSYGHFQFVEYRANKISNQEITQSAIQYVNHITNIELNPKIRFRNYLKQLAE